MNQGTFARIHELLNKAQSAIEDIKVELGKTQMTSEPKQDQALWVWDVEAEDFVPNTASPKKAPETWVIEANFSRSGWRQSGNYGIDKLFSSKEEAETALSESGHKSFEYRVRRTDEPMPPAYRVKFEYGGEIFESRNSGLADVLFKTEEEAKEAISLYGSTGSDMKYFVVKV